MGRASAIASATSSGELRRQVDSERRNRVGHAAHGRVDDCRDDPLQPFGRVDGSVDEVGYVVRDGLGGLEREIDDGLAGAEREVEAADGRRDRDPPPGASVSGSLSRVRTIRSASRAPCARRAFLIPCRRLLERRTLLISRASRRGRDLLAPVRRSRPGARPRRCSSRRAASTRSAAASSASRTNWSICSTIGRLMPKEERRPRARPAQEDELGDVDQDLAQQRRASLPSRSDRDVLAEHEIAHERLPPRSRRRSRPVRRARPAPRVSARVAVAGDSRCGTECIDADG